jgi:GNAT superfamily N-acetyltransferase
MTMPQQDRKSSSETSPLAFGPTVVFRRATPGDREGILAVAAKHPGNWIPYAIDEGLARPQGGFFVAESSGRVVAICQAHGWGDLVWLDAMRVDPEFQDRGLATGLTCYILEAGARWGGRRVRLTTAAANAAVHHFIGRKLGFRPVGRWVYASGSLDPASLRPRQSPRDPAVRTRIAPSHPAVIDAVQDLLGRSAREGTLSPGGLLSAPDDPWRLADLTREGLARLVEAGWVRIHEGGSAEEPKRREGALAIDGVAFAAVFAESPFAPGEPGWISLTCLEGKAEGKRALLEDILTVARGLPSAESLSVSLAGSQWTFFETLVAPGWSPEGLDLDAVVYERNIGNEGTWP